MEWYRMMEPEECADRLSGREKWLTCKFAFEVTPKNNPKIKVKYCKQYGPVLQRDRTTKKWYWICTYCRAYWPKGDVDG